MNLNLCLYWALFNVSVWAHEDGVLLEQVLDWTKSQGGFISRKVEIQQIFGDLYGIFAKRPIKKGEIITSISWSILLRAEDEYVPWCDSVDFVRHAITKDPDFQTPYERYLSRRSRKHVPIFWSEPGKDLLVELIAGRFPLFNGIKNDLESDWSDENCTTPFDEHHLDAMMILQTRGEGPQGIDLIPIHDLLNHRNGRHTNVRPLFDEGKKYLVVAKRDILVGEQLQNSYNQCDWCDTFSNPSNGPRSFQVTPQLFELYGFVELIPQRWVIPCHRLFFDIDEDGSDLVVDFVVPPSRDGIAFLKDQIEVLQHFETEHRMRSDIPEHELEAIMKLHTAMETAFTLAIEQSKGQITDEVWHWDEDDWYMEDDEESEDDDVEDPDDEESEVDDEEEPDAEENEDDDEEGPGHQQDYSEL